MSITVSEQQKASLLEALKEGYGATDLSVDLARLEIKYLLPDGTIIGGNNYRTHNWALNIPVFKEICNKNGIAVPYRSDEVARLLEKIAGTIQVTRTQGSYIFLVYEGTEATAQQLQAIEKFYSDIRKVADDRGFRLSAGGVKKTLAAYEITADSLRDAFEAIVPSKGRAR